LCITKNTAKVLKVDVRLSGPEPPVISLYPDHGGRDPQNFIWVGPCM